VAARDSPMAIERGIVEKLPSATKQLPRLMEMFPFWKAIQNKMWFQQIGGSFSDDIEKDGNLFIYLSNLIVTVQKVTLVW
jgi:hypothetical protein